MLLILSDTIAFAGCLMLILAGGAKLVSPQETSKLLHKLGQGTSFQALSVLLARLTAIRILAAVEIGVGIVRLTQSSVNGHVSNLMCASLYAGFASVTLAARKRGAACGCFGRWSEGKAGVADVAMNSCMSGAFLIGYLHRGPDVLSTKGHYATAAVGCLILLFLMGIRLNLSPQRRVRSSNLVGPTIPAASHAPTSEQPLATRVAPATPSRRTFFASAFGVSMSALAAAATPGAFAASAKAASTRSNPNVPLVRLANAGALASDALADEAYSTFLARVEQAWGVSGWLPPEAYLVTLEPEPGGAVSANVLALKQADTAELYWIASGYKNGTLIEMSLGIALFRKTGQALKYTNGVTETTTIGALNDQVPTFLPKVPANVTLRPNDEESCDQCIEGEYGACAGIGVAAVFCCIVSFGTICVGCAGGAVAACGVMTALDCKDDCTRCLDVGAPCQLEAECCSESCLEGRCI